MSILFTCFSIVGVLEDQSLIDIRGLTPRPQLVHSDHINNHKCQKNSPISPLDFLNSYLLFENPSYAPDVVSESSI